MKDVPGSDPLAPRPPVLLLALLLGACGAGSTDAPEEAWEASDERTVSLAADRFPATGEDESTASATSGSIGSPALSADGSAAARRAPTSPVAPEPEPDLLVVEPAAALDVDRSADIALGARGDTDTVSEADAISPFSTRPETAPEAALEAAPETAPETALAPAPATAPPIALTAKSDVPRKFVSSTTHGFTGELLDDGTVRVAWPAEPDARGYNVYRQAEYVTTVHGPEYIDEDIFDRDYYYEVHAFDGASPARFSTIATGLTVRVRGLGKPDPDAKLTNEDMLDGYDLVFSDEFDTGVLDASKWNTSYLWGPNIIINSEEQYYVDSLRDPDFGFDPFTFEDGALVINAVRTPPALRDKARGQPYLSGTITSYDAFKFTYGYVEARARVPFGRGYWPAFWLLNAYYVDDEPEIDIMEFIGHDQDVVYHTYHYYDADGTLRSTESEPTPGVDYTAGFHTYAVDWRPGLIVYYIDGVEVHRISDPRVSRQDMYVIANLAVGGWWAGSPDASTPLPGRYELDYIRVYRQTRPYGEPPLSDGESQVEPASTVPGASPAHRPPFELWPEGYPGQG